MKSYFVVQHLGTWYIGKDMTDDIRYTTELLSGLHTLYNPLTHALEVQLLEGAECSKMPGVRHALDFIKCQHKATGSFENSTTSLLSGLWKAVKEWLAWRAEHKRLCLHANQLPAAEELDSSSNYQADQCNTRTAIYRELSWLTRKMKRLYTAVRDDAVRRAILHWEATRQALGICTVCGGIGQRTECLDPAHLCGCCGATGTYVPYTKDCLPVERSKLEPLPLYEKLSFSELQQVLNDLQHLLDENPKVAPYLTDAEEGTVLAALRYCQEHKIDLSGHESFENDVKPLDSRQIDRLIENKLYQLVEPRDWGQHAAE